MADEQIIDDEVEIDEPQFTVPEQKEKKEGEKKKPGLLPVIVMLVVALGLLGGVIYFIFTGGFSDLLNKKPQVNGTTREIVVDTQDPVSSELNGGLPTVPTATVQEQQRIDDTYDVFEPSLNVVQESGNYEITPNVESPERTKPINNGAAQSTAADVGVTATVLRELQSIKASLSTINSDINALKGELMSVHRALGQQNIDTQGKINSLGQALKGVDVGVGENGRRLEAVLSGVSGFKSEAEQKRKAFTFKVLHQEVYGGKKRLVGFDVNSPSTPMKVYEGGEIGFWRLIEIKGNEAVFKHRDGESHVESLL